MTLSDAPVGPTAVRPDDVPPAGAHLARLAERCAAAAAEVAVGDGSLARLAAAADELDAALGRMAGPTTSGRDLIAARDAAGDLLAALCAAGLGRDDRQDLAGTLARLLTDVAAAIRAGP